MIETSTPTQIMRQILPILSVGMHFLWCPHYLLRAGLGLEESVQSEVAATLGYRSASSLAKATSSERPQNNSAR